MKETRSELTSSFDKETAAVGSAGGGDGSGAGGVDATMMMFSRKANNGIGNGGPRRRRRDSPPPPSSSFAVPSVETISVANASGNASGAEGFNSFEEGGAAMTTTATTTTAAASTKRSRVLPTLPSLTKATTTRIAGYARDESTSSEESEMWGEEGDGDEVDDPVGDAITEMLNERGRVPHFGYVGPPETRADIEEGGGGDGGDGFKLFPLFTGRNCRAALKFLRGCWNGDRRFALGEERQQRRPTTADAAKFALETLAACYVTIYSLSDVAVRSLAELSLLAAAWTVSTVLWTVLFDLGELKRAALALSSPPAASSVVGRVVALPGSSSSLIRDALEVSRLVAGKVCRVVERELLWGRHFEGRSLLWSDESGLLRFRRRHRQVIATNHRIKHNRRERKRNRAERRRREKRGEALTRDEVDRMEGDDDERGRLRAALGRLELRPPTFFPDELPTDASSTVVRGAGGGTASDLHMESLRYCQRMIFAGERGQHEGLVKPVLIRPSGRNKSESSTAVTSPREAIEVVDQFPDIGGDVDLDNNSRSDESVSTTFTDGQSVDYHCGADSDDCSSDDDGDGDDFGESDSEGSYATQVSAKSMPWMVVGAQVGHKILTAKRFMRLLDNAEAKNAAQSLLPEEAQRLISPREDDPSPSKASSWEGPVANSSDVPVSPASLGLSQAKSDELPPGIKRPVHGMWTNAGSAARTPSDSYGAVTLSASQNDSNLSPLAGDDHSTNSFSSKLARNGLSITTTQYPLRELGQIGVGSIEGYGTPSRLLKQMPTTPPKVQGVDDTPRISNAMQNIFGKTKRHPPIPVTRLALIEKGVKIAVPMFPPNCRSSAVTTSGPCFYQMGTVLSSLRIYVPPSERPKLFRRKKKTNCLSIKVILDKAILRGSKFAEMNLRIMDEWNYAPRHSKFAIGSCVATSFGVGVLVGWRVEDDMHIIRSLWNRSGPGSGLAYLRRDTVHSVVEAAVGFDVQTTYGAGKVVAYTRGGKMNADGKYLVHMNGNAHYRGPAVIEFNRCQILSCQGATFRMVTEHIRAAALYRLEVLHYKAALRERMLNAPTKGVRDKGMWRNFSEYVDLFANSFSKAIAEDPDFDSEVDKLFSHIISLLDVDENKKDDEEKVPAEPEPTTKTSGVCPTSPVPDTDSFEGDAAAGWAIKDIFGCFFVDPHRKKDSAIQPEENPDVMLHVQAFEEAHDSAGVLIRVLLRTLSVARASVPDRPKLHMALATMQEALLFIRQVLRVQKKHTSRNLIEAWFRALDEIADTFGPLKQRMAALGAHMAKKFRKHGNVAKRRILRFVDIALSDTQLLHALELGDWKKSCLRLEVAIVQSNITDAATCEQLRKGLLMMYKNLAPRKKDRKSKAAAARNGQKMVNFAKILKVVASPGRSFLRLLTHDDVLELFDRVLIRVFEKDPQLSMVINIHASNFESFRHLRFLVNMSVSGRLWETVLDAIDEELTFATSEIPHQTKDLVEPFVKLFSLGVSQFHSIQQGNSNGDWLEFLMHDEAVTIIQDLDFRLIASLEALCTDIKQVVQVLPYIKTIDNDILNLMDEFNLDQFIKEITEVIGDPDKSLSYITERSAILVERFLDYLPRMSIPIERRELQDGWVLTCRGKDGGDLRLSDLRLKRENLLLSVLGNDNVFADPSGGKDDYIGSPKNRAIESVWSDLTDDEEEETVLDELKELILSAQSHGNWQTGIGGLRAAHCYQGVPPPLNGFPLSDHLKTQIDLWQTSAISDFELLETAIREVSHQIQLQKERDENGADPQEIIGQFNPRVDPTVLYLDITNLTLRLEDFGFRVEKDEPLTIFDPVFEGCGTITVQNVSIVLKVEVKKERVIRGGIETPRPVLQLSKFDIGLEKLKLEFVETGADWILNAVLKGFSRKAAEIVEENLKEQIAQQVHTLLEQINGFIDNNPDLLLTTLGITMADIEESIACV